MKYDVLIIGGGVAGISCALLLGSSKNEPFSINKKIGIITHQKSSSLQNAVLNNVLGLEKNTQGDSILEIGKKQLKENYPHVEQIELEKVLEISGSFPNFKITTTRNTHLAENIVVAIGPKNFSIKGFETYAELHKNLPPEKKRTQLKNNHFLVAEGVYVAGTLAGLRSQYAIAAGSGTQVATDILTKWNNNTSVMIHDKKNPT